MRRNLPPLAAIRVFEAAARHHSFTRAAQELGMTQAAVSYQIKVLEDRVGTGLFLRRPRGVDLTDAGQILSRKSGQALDLLQEAYAEAKGETEQTLTLSAIPTFATNILAQMLVLFQIANPTIALRLSVGQSLLYFETEDFDAAIRSGVCRWPA